MIACQHCFSKNAADVVCVMREGSFAAIGTKLRGCDVVAKTYNST
jgi:hypothetical protein